MERISKTAAAPAWRGLEGIRASRGIPAGMGAIGDFTRARGVLDMGEALRRSQVSGA
jgi:hypothetical protein